jgi:hypothetical protein
LIFVNEQLHQSTGVTEEDHQLNPDPQSRSHSAAFPPPAA